MTKQIGDRQAMFKKTKDGQARAPLPKRRSDDTLVLAGGRNGSWTPHDLRGTGATMMQVLGVPLDTIDRCQNHVLSGSKVCRHYMRHDYASEKREAWRLLGERLFEILQPPNGARNVVPIRARGRLIEKWKVLMQVWAECCAKPAVSGQRSAVSGQRSAPA